MSTTPDALIFVYNANAGTLAGLMDTVHKTLSPSTYECQLCAVTFGAFSMRPEWRNWLKSQPWEAVFHHRPDFRAAFPAHADVALPAILRRDGDALSVVLDSAAMRAVDDIPALIAALEVRLSA